MEKEFIAWLVEHYQSTNEHVAIGPGDDACVLNSTSDQIVVSTDTIADGIHFDGSSHSLTQIGYKAMAVSLSDIAAMGACPVAATVNFMCPRVLQLSQLKELFDGMWNAGALFNAPIVGGDTNRWDGKLVLGTTVFGAAYENSKTGFWQLSGGIPGDSVLVSGSLGGSIQGKHIDFEPRLNLAKYLMQNFFVTAATDVTDSLAMDLAGLAKKSNCGFQIVAERLPIADAANELSQHSGRNAMDHALYDGEDFELIVCASPDVAENIIQDPTVGNEFTLIGNLTSSDSFMIVSEEKGTERELEIRGFIH